MAFFSFKLSAMAIKEDVMRILEEWRGETVSGQQLADTLGVSRQAVSKAVSELRLSGQSILAVPGKGYTLEAGSAGWSVPGISKYLSADTWRLDLREAVGSTNDEVRQAAREGQEEGYVCLARSQSAGRGRRGRVFYSPGHTGLYLSVLLRPGDRLALSDAVQITVLAAVAAAEAIEAVSGRPADIKWVNDLLMDDRKVAGILTEGELDLEGRRLNAAVLGLGFNICPPADGWLEELDGIAGSIWPSADALPADAVNRFTGLLLNKIGAYYNALPGRPYLDDYRKRSVLQDRLVDVHQGNKQWLGRVLGIDDDANLILRTADGRTEILGSGEVSIRMNGESGQ